jgi:pyruvate dehydrogenase E2 component (dihydrolipoamide acetyltransferase)
MPELVRMPKLGFDMAEGTLIRKLKQAGDAVSKGDVLAEIETDKAMVEIEAPADGAVKGWLVEEGQAVPVGALMAVIAAPAEVVDLGALRAGGPAEARRTPPAGAAPAAATPSPASATPLPAPSGPIFASPLARNMAAQADLDLRQIQGSGPRGRVVRKDVEAYLHGQPPTLPLPQTSARQAPPPAVPAAAPAPGDQAVPLTRLRQAIARRMVESNQAVPPFYVTTQIDMDPAMALRRQLNELLPEAGKISVNDLIIKAAALTLRQFPNINATFAGDKIVRRGHVNIGVAVGIEGGLLTVVVKDADQKPLGTIAAEAKALISRARSGKVQAADIEDSTFSISNLGMYQVTHFIAIVNPPEAAVLATGQVQSVPVVKAGAVVPGLLMETTLSADHRVTDGVEAAQFIQAFRQTLDAPLRLLI